MLLATFNCSSYQQLEGVFIFDFEDALIFGPQFSNDSKIQF